MRRKRDKRGGKLPPSGAAVQGHAGSGWWLDKAPYVLPGIAALLMVPYLASNFIQWSRMMAFPAEINIGEGVLQFEALLLSRGDAIYKSPDTIPYWFATYPPLYQWVVSLWTEAGYLWMRAISFLSSLGSAGLLSVLVFVGTRNVAAAAVAPLLWLLSPFTDNWTVVGRVDMLGRLFESVAFALVFLAPGRLWATVAAAIVASLAMWTKQTMIAGGIAAAAVLWFDSRRHAVIFAALWVGITTAGYGVMTFATDGWFWRNVFGDTGRENNPDFLILWASRYALLNWATIGAAVMGALLAARDRTARAFGFAALAGLPSVLLSANDGSDVNYFFDLHWGLCGLAAIGAGHLLRMARWQRLAAGLMLVAGPVATWILLSPMPGPTREHAELAHQIVADLRAQGQPVLTEFVGYGLAAGSEPDYLPYMFKKLEDRGKWDSSDMVARVRNGHYRAALLTTRETVRWGRPILEALAARYEPAKRYDGSFMIEGLDSQVLWVPRRQ